MEKKASTFFSKIDSEGFEYHKSWVCEGCPLFLIKVYDEKGISTEKGVFFTVNLQLFIPNFFWIFDCWHFGFPNVDLTALITSLNEYFVAYSNEFSFPAVCVQDARGKK